MTSTAYMKGFEAARAGYQYDDNPYDYWLSHDEWRAWFDGWSAYRRCNGIYE